MDVRRECVYNVQYVDESLARRLDLYGEKDTELHRVFEERIIHRDGE